MVTLFQRFFTLLCFLFKYKWALLGVIVAPMLIALAIGKIYQGWDDDPDRGAIPISDGAFGESYSKPIYLDQGWDESDSLWYYNTTQGSGLVPYDFFIVLEEETSEALLRSNKNMDKYRYLPQKPTFFNPDGLPVGFVKDTYQGKDYVGYTCAACHTGQINYKGQAMRIDGGPSMADMVGFLTALEKSMSITLKDDDKRQRFVENVIALDNDFDSENEVVTELEQWTKTIRLYNTVNHSKVDYGYARLDAFGRIYNRVLQHIINKDQFANILASVVSPTGNRVVSDEEISRVLEGINASTLGDKEFATVLERLESKEPGYPGLNQRDMLRVRNQFFNEANAPVSYPFLWDIAQSNYVQWNGLANNASVGPLGRNTGEVIGVFGILDWSSHEPDDFSLSAMITDQKRKSEIIDFKSSINLVNLQRLESHLKSLQSPVWPEDILGKIDRTKADKGRLIYQQYCQSCHEVVDRDNADRIVVAKMSELEFIGTDVAMAENSATYTGKSGNFQHTTQAVEGVGTLFIEEDAPVVQILTSATKGVIATPDPDKWWIRRWLDRIYTIAMALFENKMPDTIKNGNYKPDTTAGPYNSVVAYKARSLNGIWATAPYLHNGSVPTLYDLLLPKKRADDPDDGVYRPDEFSVGRREFDPVKVGFVSDDNKGFIFRATRRGDMNSGHEYGAGRTPQMDGTQLPALTEEQRWELIEYIKTL
ncbi:ribonuclease E [Candidatus Endobugula sertula]|uniref:Ribonuclease E n=1 Tax=Candidatus Endobugula sertula TaxID=62101 RepID=A0A1D2QMK4_9GAMM|nr:ribonuclease E [Candidatus Endobugula sertula]